MAAKMMSGQLDYSILDFKIYEKFRADVNAILISEGREDLIKR